MPLTQSHSVLFLSMPLIMHLGAIWRIPVAAGLSSDQKMRASKLPVRKIALASAIFSFFLGLAIFWQWIGIWALSLMAIMFFVDPFLVYKSTTTVRHR
jgi:hypothetical protein